MTNTYKTREEWLVAATQKLQEQVSQACRS